MLRGNESEHRGDGRQIGNKPDRNNQLDDAPLIEYRQFPQKLIITVLDANVKKFADVPASKGHGNTTTVTS